MKVLIISHNPICPTTAMGRTLGAWFHDFSWEETAQFYIRPEPPGQTPQCRDYYRFTDMDALCPGRKGQIFDTFQVCPEAAEGGGKLEGVYQIGRKRTGGIYLLRNCLWKHRRWDNERLWQWVHGISPDVIFLAAGDYAFQYEIAATIARRLKKPLAVACVDDFYIYNRNEKSWLGRVVHRSFLRTVHDTMQLADLIITICPEMKAPYEILFGKHCQVLYTPVEKSSFVEEAPAGGICYIGNLGLSRHRQLIDMGRALRMLDLPGVPKWIDVYSGERNSRILRELAEEPGIRLHGPVGRERVLEILAGSIAVIHTESFDPKIREITRYSVSTKIGDCLMNGPCLIAYGPAGIASVDYLREHEAAFVITSPQMLESGLREILTDGDLRSVIQENARGLAEKNHNLQKNAAQMRSWLAGLCREER